MNPVPTARTPKGVVVYRGPSLYNGKEIVVIVTGLRRKSKNAKTGDMLQTWILYAGSNPLEANKCGDDDSICGTCKHKHFRSCYVNLCHGPSHIYKAWKRGEYVNIGYKNAAIPWLFAGRDIRIGSYGEPAFVPIEVWNAITGRAAGWTGYSHAWKTCSTEYKRFCMASCDTVEEADNAKARGWRVFYVRQKNEELDTKRFFVCPASAEGGKKVTCKQCSSCRGGNYTGGRCPSIVIHAPSWKMIYYSRGMKLMKNKKKYVGVFSQKISGGKTVKSK